MKITPQQIEALYKFTHQHYVEHFDVQTELVDHLANDIEQIWVAQPHLSFEQARDISFKKFGIFGFMDVVEARFRAMQKRYWKIIWRFAKEWFQLPKIIITVLIFLMILSLFQFKYGEYFLLSLMFFAVIWDLYHMKKNNKKQKRKDKVFLLESMLNTTQHSFLGFTFLNFFNIINTTKVHFFELAFTWQVLIAIFTTNILIFMYVINNVVPKKAEQLLLETYPEYNLVKNM